MSVDGFPNIMIPLEQQGCVNSSVQAIWPKKQALSPETELLNFQTAELHILLEAICALTPSLQISDTGYSSPINCHTPHHELYVNDSCGLSSNPVHLIRDNLEMKLPEHCSPDSHSLSMASAQPLRRDFGHPWEPSPVTLPRGSPKTKSTSSSPGATTTPNCTNPSNPTTPLPLVNANHLQTDIPDGSRGQHPPRQNTNYWPRKSRKRNPWLLKMQTTKILDTIPENQEWRLQDVYQQNNRNNVLPEITEPKSVFENDSDSEDED
ncbi:hypothetical protein Pst134EA_009566 [Puccinia striiformis f. sp. tritici]|uniref:Uncharacterized protein n=1 Tax=Puccinia striiformis f. sp. tritici PST-78 TaxID=1165861 RepID=A0A0L0VGF1_9BASI|nr:hypothetical protein Pst134EA_009566 [Puccinia striiformis f. sp. tritici]KAH9469044.1 hypothetical protein Pst134EA_009566 [Puccinia striiformis f. sp. tritici]KNE98301.1 hypothetical protein PSTG_08377 [Puccinia striiformis f. sp. tritici PST-78]